MSMEQAYARLESKVDHLETELDYLNKILIKVGFASGISTLKQTVYDLLKEDQISRQSAGLDEIL